VKRLSTLPLETAHIEKMTKLLHAIGMQSVEGNRWTVSPYVTFDRSDQLVERLVARKSINRIGTRHRTTAFEPVQQSKETRFYTTSTSD